VTVPYPDVTGVLVAGGRATRLGRLPKGLLAADGEALAARSLRLFRELFGAALVVANDPAPYAALGAPVLPDAIPGKGPPGGVHAALAAAGTRWIFAAACDMPFLSAEAVALLASRREGAVAVVPRWAGRLEPLHALWSRACLPVFEHALRAGNPSLRELARLAGALEVEEAAWRLVDPAGRAFENANTPEDVARLGLGR
jgi:molybdopterin-guanine dinucleotide biosynthesis protein A